ncbi:MAG: hypothetical protein ACPHK8_00600 [Thermoplasmatota archaeon]
MNWQFLAAALLILPSLTAAAPIELAWGPEELPLQAGHVNLLRISIEAPFENETLVFVELETPPGVRYSTPMAAFDTSTILKDSETAESLDELEKCGVQSYFSNPTLAIALIENGSADFVVEATPSTSTPPVDFIGFSATVFEPDQFSDQDESCDPAQPAEFTNFHAEIPVNFTASPHDELLAATARFIDSIPDPMKSPEALAAEFGDLKAAVEPIRSAADIMVKLKKDLQAIGWDSYNAWTVAIAQFPVVELVHVSAQGVIAFDEGFNAVYESASLVPAVLQATDEFVSYPTRELYDAVLSRTTETAEPLFEFVEATLNEFTNENSYVMMLSGLYNDLEDIRQWLRDHDKWYDGGAAEKAEEVVVWLQEQIEAVFSALEAAVQYLVSQVEAEVEALLLQSLSAFYPMPPEAQTEPPLLAFSMIKGEEPTSESAPPATPLIVLLGLALLTLRGRTRGPSGGGSNQPTA